MEAENLEIELVGMGDPRSWGMPCQELHHHQQQNRSVNHHRLEAHRLSSLTAGLEKCLKDCAWKERRAGGQPYSEVQMLEVEEVSATGENKRTTATLFQRGLPIANRSERGGRNETRRDEGEEGPGWQEPGRPGMEEKKDGLQRGRRPK